jgi:ABC-2 type transport system permease protein
MHALLRYSRIWGASMRYSITRQMMFRGDFLIWLITDFLWISVNVLLVEVIYSHSDGIAGWNKHEMLLLIGSALLQQRLFMGLFFTGFHEMGRAIRTGTFDFFIAQPGSVLFMVSTRRLELDGISNTLVAAAIVVHAALKLDITFSAPLIAAYLAATACGVLLLYAVMSLMCSMLFTEFARLPKQAYQGISAVLIGGSVIVMSSNVPANLLRGLVSWEAVGWLALWAAAALALAVWTFHQGLRRYTSASS